MTFNDFLADLTSIANAFFSSATNVFTLMTTNFILCCVIGLWLLRKVIRLFQRIL